MGSLTLPARGPIYLDANGFIYSVERIEPYRTLLEPLWQHAQEGQFQIVSSELTLLLTNDPDFRRIPDVPATVLGDLVS